MTEMFTTAGVTSFTSGASVGSPRASGNGCAAPIGEVSSVTASAQITEYLGSRYMTLDCKPVTSSLRHIVTSRSETDY
jgi:hypothetical protein